MQVHFDKVHDLLHDVSLCEREMWNMVCSIVELRDSGVDCYSQLCVLQVDTCQRS